MGGLMRGEGLLWWVSEGPDGWMVVLAGVEVLGSFQISHNHSLGMGVDGQGWWMWGGGLMRRWVVMLDCGVRECSNITLCFKEQWDWYRWTGVYQIRVQTLHNKPFGMRVNGHGTSCYWLVQTVWFLLLLCVNSCIRLSLVGIIVYSFISHNTTFPQHERSEAERMRGPQRMR